MPNALLISYAGYPYTPSSLCPDNGLGTLAAVLRDAGWTTRILDFGTVSMMRRLYPEELSRKATPLLVELMQRLASAAAADGPPPELPDAVRSALSSADAALTAHQEKELDGVADEVIREVQATEPAFVGFKLWNGDGFSGSVALAHALRRRFPDLKLYAGGPHATWGGSLIFRYTDVFDAVVLGEAEQTLLALAEHATTGTSLAGTPGVALSVDSSATPRFGQPVEDIPFPVYDPDTYPALVGDEKLKLMVVDECRGCPHACAFCTHPSESGRRLRLRGAGSIVDHMQQVAQTLGTHAFRFAGSSTPGALMASIADELLRRGLRVQYSSFGHAATAGSEHFARMRASGLRALFYGMETGSEKLRRRSAGKPLTNQQLEQVITAARAADLLVACSLIVPMPGETPQTLDESFELLCRLRPDSVPVQPPALLPGTPWLEQPERYGFEVDAEAYLLSSLDYKIKLFLPPALWAPLPYRLDGRSFAQFSALTSAFQARLERAGILTGVPDDNMLMALLTGMGLREFRDRARLWCLTGDASAMQAFVQGFNRAASLPA